jgi:hypothetical protein
LSSLAAVIYEFRTDEAPGHRMRRRPGVYVVYEVGSET